MSNPVLALTEWLKSLDHDEQIDIAVLMSGHYPVFHVSNIPQDLNQAPRHFYQKIEEFSGAEIWNAGFLIGFRAIFNYMFLMRRGTDEGWAETRSLYQTIIDSEEGVLPSDMKASAAKALTELSVGQEVWKHICESWRTLTAGPLSDEAIQKWEKEIFVQRSQETRQVLRRPVAHH